MKEVTDVMWKRFSKIMLVVSRTSNHCLISIFGYQYSMKIKEHSKQIIEKVKKDKSGDGYKKKS